MDVLHNVKQYFSLTKKEARDMAITALVIGFIFSFNEWGVETFNFTTGLFSWFNAFLVCILAVLVHVVSQKIFAVYKGYQVNYKVFTIGLVVCLLVAFYSNGSLALAVPGIMAVSMIKHFGVGRRFGGKYQRHEAFIAFIGPLANVILALIFQGITNLGVSNQLVQKVIIVNVSMAIVSILPIPSLPGFKIFYHSRVWGLFSMVFIIGLAVFLTWFSFWQTVMTALVLAILFSIVYFLRFEL
jgi:hypothetical protein